MNVGRRFLESHHHDDCLLSFFDAYQRSYQPTRPFSPLMNFFQMRLPWVGPSIFQLPIKTETRIPMRPMTVLDNGNFFEKIFIHVYDQCKEFFLVILPSNYANSKATALENAVAIYDWRFTNDNLNASALRARCRAANSCKTASRAPIRTVDCFAESSCVAVMSALLSSSFENMKEQLNCAWS